MSRDKPFSFQAAEDAGRRSQLNQDDIMRYAPSARLQTWTPAIVATNGGTSPTYVPDSVGTKTWGRYIVANNILFMWFQVAILSISASGNDTIWGITTPISIAVDVGPKGVFQMTQAAGSQLGQLSPANAGALLMIYQTSFTALGFVGFNTPGAWLAGSFITGGATCRVPDGFNA